jgi:hypothetical protein
MRCAYIPRVHALPPPANSDEPNLGAIKRALHELARSNSAALHEAHDLLRELARRNGVDPDAAVQRSRAAVKAQRAQLIRASALMSDQTSS